MGRFGWAMTHSKLTCAGPDQRPLTSLGPDPLQADVQAIRDDDTSEIGKGLCTKSGLPH